MLGTMKTEEIVFGSTSDSHKVCIVIHNGKKTKQVFPHKYWGVVTDHLLSWTDHIEFVCRKTKQSLYFVRRLRSFGASRQILHLFFNVVIMSVEQCCNTAWYKCLSTTLKSKQMTICSKIGSQALEKL